MPNNGNGNKRRMPCISVTAFSREQYKAVREAASAQGLPLATWLRHLALEALAERAERAEKV